MFYETRDRDPVVIRVHSDNGLIYLFSEQGLSIVLQAKKVCIGLHNVNPSCVVLLCGKLHRTLYLLLFRVDGLVVIQVTHTGCKGKI